MSARLQLAILAFEAYERADFLADRKRRECNAAASQLEHDDVPEYFTATEAIRHSFEAKREKAGIS